MCKISEEKRKKRRKEEMRRREKERKEKRRGGAGGLGGTAGLATAGGSDHGTAHGTGGAASNTGNIQGGWGTRRYHGRYPGPEAPASPPPDRALLATWPPPAGLARAAKSGSTGPNSPVLPATPPLLSNGRISCPFLRASSPLS